MGWGEEKSTSGKRVQCVEKAEKEAEGLKDKAVDLEHGGPVRKVHGMKLEGLSFTRKDVTGRFCY